MDFLIKNRATMLQSRIFEVQRLRVQMPDAQEHTYDIINHPGAVAMLPLDNEGNLLFVSQIRPAIGQVSLEIPAGTLEAGEEPLYCAHRELREETGMDAHQMQALGVIFLAPGYSSERLHLFLARDLFPSPLQSDADEFLNIRRIPVAEAYRMAAAGEMSDAKSLAALLVAKAQMD